MDRVRKISLVVWLTTVVLFVLAVVVSIYKPELKFSGIKEIIATALLATDVGLGILSFITLLISDALYSAKKYPNTKKRLVVLIIVFVGLFGVLAGYILGNKDKLFEKPLAPQDGPMQSIPEPTQEPEQEEQITEEPKHGYQAQALVQTKNDNYFVNGNDRKELCSQVVERAEEEENLGYINYEIKDNYYTISTTRGYSMGYFTITAISTLTVPQWTSSEGASEGTKSDWRAFKNAIASHEGKHQEILVKYANKLVQAYNNMGYYETEASLDGAITEAYSRVQKDMDKEQKDFDEREAGSKSLEWLCRR